MLLYDTDRPATEGLAITYSIIDNDNVHVACLFEAYPLNYHSVAFHKGHPSHVLLPCIALDHFATWHSFHKVPSE